jgi:hypothetical protein
MEQIKRLAPMSFGIAIALAFSGCDSSVVPDSAQDADTAVDAMPDAPPFTPALKDSNILCKLLSNRNAADPTPNDVQHNANVLGADLGIPVVANDSQYILFGDTIGFNTIWPGGESHPDAVGYGLDTAAAIAADPSLLCRNLRIVSLPPSSSIGPTVSSSIRADFAGAAMIAPVNHSLAEYIHNPAGKQGGALFPQLPGDFEVPSGAFSVDGKIYVFYTTVVGPGNIDMRASYLARWDQPATTGPFAYQILYQVDERFDADGPLGGHYINIAAEVAGSYLYIFGTGEYRRSSIHVARKPLAMLDQPGGFEELGEIVGVRGYGELSVHYFSQIQRWVLLAEELTTTTNHIVAYFAASPEGPWTSKTVVHDMADPEFRSKYCCTNLDDCSSTQFFNCTQTGFYGTYMFPTLIDSQNEFTMTYTMSSFSPYNVALFQSTFAKR